MPRHYHYQLVDVFSDEIFCGNPLAVFTDADGLEPQVMQKIAAELGLSETTFVLPSEDPAIHYRVRTFTPTTELDMGGHPTIGTAFALAHVAKLEQTQRVVFQQPSGPVSVTMVSPMMTMRYPPAEFLAPYEDTSAIAGMLSLDPDDILQSFAIQAVSCGAPFTLVPVRGVPALESIQFRTDIWRRTMSGSHAPNVVVFTMAVAPPLTARARVFAPGLGFLEDAATSTAGGALGAYMARHRLVPASPEPHIIISQGVELGRPSQIHVFPGAEGAPIRVGGQCVWVGRGEIMVP